MDKAGNYLRQAYQSLSGLSGKDAEAAREQLATAIKAADKAERIASQNTLRVVIR